MSGTFQIIFPLFGLVFAASTFAFAVFRTRRYDAQLAGDRARENSLKAQTSNVSDELSMGSLLSPMYGDSMRQHEEATARVHAAVKAAASASSFAGGSPMFDIDFFGDDATRRVVSVGTLGIAGMNKVILGGRDTRTGQYAFNKEVAVSITKGAEDREAS